MVTVSIHLIYIFLEKSNLKSTKNDKISNESSTVHYNQLRWISIGNPKLTKRSNHQQNLSIVQSTDENFSFHFNMLNGQDRQALKGDVKIVKKIDVPTQSFVDLEPSLLECALKISNKQFKRVEILKGSVRDFTQTPYELEFDYGIGSK